MLEMHFKCLLYFPRLEFLSKYEAVILLNDILILELEVLILQIHILILGIISKKI